MNGTVPAYLYEKGNTVKMILFTALFALLFINFFQPFGSREWYPDISDFTYFAFSSLIILTGMLVVVVSRVILSAYAKRRPVSYWQYALHVFFEIVAMALFYSLFSKLVPQDGVDKDFTDLLRQNIVNTALILLLPYAISWLYFSWKEKSALLENIEQEKALETHARPLVGFYDEKGDLKISVMLDNLLYIESADNYATIHYLNKSKQSHFLLRNSLKWMEENLTKETPLTRCHRSFIVNMDKVKILKKVKGGIVLELDADNTPDLPVSKTYYDAFMMKFSQYTV